MENTGDLVYRLRERARIRRQIPTKRSVLLGETDRLADLLEEAAYEIERIRFIEKQVTLMEHLEFERSN
jgi:hypothetical protein